MWALKSKTETELIPAHHKLYQERTYITGRFQAHSSAVKVVRTRRNADFAYDRPSDLFGIPGRSSERSAGYPTIVSVNPQVSPDIVAMIGASATLGLSGIPFSGPIGTARVGYIKSVRAEPDQDELITSRLDLVVAGT